MTVREPVDSEGEFPVCGAARPGWRARRPGSRWVSRIEIEAPRTLSTPGKNSYGWFGELTVWNGDKSMRPPWFYVLLWVALGLTLVLVEVLLR